MDIGTRVSGLKRRFMISEATTILCQDVQKRGELVSWITIYDTKLCNSGAKFEVKGCAIGYFTRRQM